MTKSQLQARVTELELAIMHADDWLRMGEGVDLLYYSNYPLRTPEIEKPSVKIIDDLINEKV